MLRIPVTKPYLPPKNEYLEYFNEAWERNWLTNHGPLNKLLEQRLKHFLGVDNLLYVANGTLAIQLGIKALDLKGEIITTPFSYVATTSSIVWENCTPIFADIEQGSLNIDPEKIEELITDRTSGIVATHVFGNPCNVKAIEKLAEKHNLKVIYDAAHAFGVKVGAKSVFAYGDVSTASFHATKFYHSVEGGAVVSKQKEVLDRMSLMQSFGHTTPTSFDGPGINAKNSEFHAAMGLCNLNHIDEILDKRKNQFNFYYDRLKKGPFAFQTVDASVEYNFAYFPLILPNEEILLKFLDHMIQFGIKPRRYFYPSLNKLNYVDNIDCPISEDISSRVICMPLYHELTTEEQEEVCERTLKFFGA